MYTDPIADLLTRIRNASSANISVVRIPHSKLKESILKILLEKKFIEKYTVEGETMPDLEVTLKESEKLTLKRISKPGQRIYMKSEKMKPLRSGRGISIISTSKGLMTSEEAKKSNLGGEVICEVI